MIQLNIMFLINRRPILQRSFYITSRYYYEAKKEDSLYKDENKSIYEMDEEKKLEDHTNVYGEKFPKWRHPWGERKGEISSKFSVFVRANPSTDVLNHLQNLPRMSTFKIKEWWADMQEIKVMENQKYLKERVDILGPNLAAAHFFTFRKAAIRWQNSREWISGVERTLDLPGRFTEGYYIEAIDCENFTDGGLRFDGMECFKDLSCLRWVSLKNNKYVDVWCMDRLTSYVCNSLEYLDISGCDITPGCVATLARLTKLCMLVLTDPGDNVELDLHLALLQKENEKLIIKTV